MASYGAGRFASLIVAAVAVLADDGGLEEGFAAIASFASSVRPGWSSTGPVLSCHGSSSIRYPIEAPGVAEYKAARPSASS